MRVYCVSYNDCTTYYQAPHGGTDAPFNITTPFTKRENISPICPKKAKLCQNTAARSRIRMTKYSSLRPLWQGKKCSRKGQLNSRLE